MFRMWEVVVLRAEAPRLVAHHLEIWTDWSPVFLNSTFKWERSFYRKRVCFKGFLGNILFFFLCFLVLLLVKPKTRKRGQPRPPGFMLSDRLPANYFFPKLDLTNPNFKVPRGPITVTHCPLTINLTSGPKSSKETDSEQLMVLTIFWCFCFDFYKKIWKVK